VLVDVESHAVLDLLPGRAKEPVAAWLAGHPGIEVICRDRAGAYAEAARAGAPNALQVADRWHLWDNLATAVERTVIAHSACLQAPEVSTLSARRMAGAPPSTLNPNTGAEKWLVTRTRERHKAVHRLLARGWTISAIARELGLARHTAERYAHCKNLDGLIEGALRTTHLDDYKPYLIRRWNEGAPMPPVSSGRSRLRATRDEPHKPCDAISRASHRPRLHPVAGPGAQTAADHQLDHVEPPASARRRRTPAG
jgi:hypothetical protein